MTDAPAYRSPFRDPRSYERYTYDYRTTEYGYWADYRAEYEKTGDPADLRAMLCYVTDTIPAETPSLTYAKPRAQQRTHLSRPWITLLALQVMLWVFLVVTM